MIQFLKDHLLLKGIIPHPLDFPQILEVLYHQFGPMYLLEHLLCPLTFLCLMWELLSDLHYSRTGLHRSRSEVNLWRYHPTWRDISPLTDLNLMIIALWGLNSYCLCFGSLHLQLLLTPLTCTTILLHKKNILY